jgi:hypothetical protein
MYSSGYGNDTLPLQQFTAMLEALLPVGDRDVELCVYAPRFVMGSEAVQELGRVLGRHLTGLELQQCQLEKHFWPAVWGHLAGLQQLNVSDQAASDISTEDVVSFCSHATHPLQLILSPVLYKRLEAGSGRFEEQCRVKGVPQVTVTEWERYS